MKQRIVTGLIGMVAFMGMLLVPQPERPPVFECQEDMACWDWRTMGDGCHGIDDYGTIECYRDGGYFIMEGLT